MMLKSRSKSSQIITSGKPESFKAFKAGGLVQSTISNILDNKTNIVPPEKKPRNKFQK